MPDTVYYDADCGFCTRSVRIVRALDWFGLFRYAPLQSAEASDIGFPEARDLSQMVFRRGGRSWGGWRAVKQVCMRLPVFYLVVGASMLFSVWIAAAILLGLSPLANPLGDAAYRWVARNRHRFPGTTCTLENR